MKNTLLIKILTIGGLMVVLLIPLLLIQSTISERALYRYEAEQSIENTFASAQTLMAPILVTTILEGYPEIREEESDGKLMKRRVQVEKKRVTATFPQSLSWTSDVQTEVRYRGIFPVKVFRSQHRFSGALIWQSPKPLHPQGKILSSETVLYVGVSDLRGLNALSAVRFGAREWRLGKLPQSPSPQWIGAVIEPSALTDNTPIPLSMEADISGTRTLNFVPIAEHNDISVKVNWPHPSFIGRFLPESHEINAEGFKARWQINALATNAQQELMALLNKTSLESNAPEKQRVNYILGESLGVSLINPVDIYTQSERASKYGFLFLVLIFGAFFIVEVVRHWRIHPMQYLMVGCALVLFFLLVLSMAEHWGFVTAYASATIASVGLIGYYLYFVLGGMVRALIMVSLLLVLYFALFVILQSEDHALLMGSALLFITLSLAMMVTRRLDWGKVNEKKD